MGPTAELIAQHLLADGFVEGGVEEAQQLAPACDRLLTRHGMSLEIVCIVDREQDATRHFVADPLALQTVARACYKHSSTRLYGVRLPCTVRVIEVGPDASAPENRSGLEELALAARNLETFFFSGWTVDRARGVVWSTQPLNGLFAGRRNLERILRDPRPPPVPTAATLNNRFPITTALLIAVLVLAFVIETESGHVGGLLGFDLATLIALGGESRDLVLGAGEWHRVLSAALLHADLLHLVINCIALYLAGAFVERLVGWTWLLALFLAGTLGGAALSLALNPPDIVSIGASSAIMGLLAAGLILSGRLAAGKARSLARNNLARFLIPSLIPLATTPHFSGQIDFAGHFGGAIAGAAVGAALLRLWSRIEPRPPRGLGRRLATASVLLFLIAAVRVGVLHPGYAQLGDMAPEKALQAVQLEPEAASARLIRDFPHDPRSHWVRGKLLESQGKLEEAEQELRLALAARAVLQTVFKPRLQRSIESDLARVLLDENKADEARRVAEAVCATPERELLSGTGLCKAD
jgi:rhomboid protease GluP